MRSFFEGDARFFKFIAGANLRDERRVEHLASVFALAGAHMIDLAAEPAVVAAATSGVARARRWFTDRPSWLPMDVASPALIPMVSITLAGDRHTEVAVVELDNCIRCDLCTPICPAGSIVNGDVAEAICTGCALCLPVCPVDVIVMLPRETAPDLAACWEAGARALEVHTGAANPDEVADVASVSAGWQARGGLLSYSIDGNQLGHGRAISLARQLGAPGTIIQADGKPISGTSGDRSTIPALRLARAMSRAGVTAWIQPAGGTNDRTATLAARYDIGIAGVGMGSFARAAAKDIEDGPDPDEDPATGPAWGLAIARARTLVTGICRPVPAPSTP